MTRRASLVAKRSAGSVLTLAALALVLLGAPVAGAEDLRNEDGTWRFTNRLADETSPYLLLHAHNPVDWYPWGPEALELAAREQRPIFLSIGYSTCYWCHVMEREVFADPDIAALMNQWFVNIKVDREERPDLDGYYMTATQLMTQGGGWPNSVFLTPELEPFYAGTYFPPEDARGRPGFPRVLTALHDAWEKDPAPVRASAARATKAIRSIQSGAAATGSSGSLDEGVLLAATDDLKAAYDPIAGGFGGAPKFPSESELGLLLTRHERTGDSELLDIVTHTLTEMARGGIHDHLAGGFHRYATDARWRVPHFEKMLYSQAQLAIVYARAYGVTGDPFYRLVAEDILEFVDVAMTSPDGAFYSALDSETHAEEGKSYLWTESEIVAALGSSSDEFLALYALERMPDGAGKVLFRRAKPLAANGAEPSSRYAAAAGSRAKLLAIRDGRDQPLLDTKLITAWNGMMIRAYAVVASALDEPRYLATAERAADFIYEELRDDDGRLQRTYRLGRARGAAYQEDYAFMASAYLALWQASGKAAHLTRTRRLADEMLETFWDDSGGGLFLTADAGDLGVRTKDPYDSAMPSGNSEAAHVLLGLAAATDDDAYLTKAATLLRAFAAPMSGYPRSFGRMLGALDTYLAMAQSASLPQASRPIDEPTGEYVSVTATSPRSPVTPGSTFDVFVTLRIAEGWHVNANPASEEFLVPTTISGAPGAGYEVVHVDYPYGRPLEALASEEPLSVYDGAVTFRVRLRAPLTDGLQAATARLVLAYQVCDNSKCLAPETLEFAVAMPQAAE
jgi:uncharacterized protein